jgi:hypothetical protein
MESVTKHKKFRILRIGCALFIILGLILFLLLINNIRWALFYQDFPQENVLEDDLVGTWEFYAPIWHHSIPITLDSLFTKKQPSLMILKQDGSYEIHNPPKYLKKFLDLQPQKQFTSSCGQVSIGKWEISEWRSVAKQTNIAFDDLRCGHRLQGRSNPYQLWYCEVAPDATPLYTWKRISKEIKCPNCQYNLPVTEGKHVKHTVR